MLVNKIVLILIILFVIVVILEYLKRDIFEAMLPLVEAQLPLVEAQLPLVEAQLPLVEGYMAIIGPVISPKIKIVDKPINSYYENNKITQDFDQYSVLQDYVPNSIIIQEEPGYVLTNAS